jgi:hypothetical protein
VRALARSTNMAHLLVGQALLFVRACLFGWSGRNAGALLVAYGVKAKHHHSPCEKRTRQQHLNDE